MSESEDFYELLQETSETVKRPQSAPECWLIGTMSGPEFSRTRKGTPKVRHYLTEIEPHPSVLKDAALAPKLEGLDLQALRSPFTSPPALAVEYWLTPDAIHMYYNMMDRVLGGKNRTGAERVGELAGSRVVFKVTPVKTDEGMDTGQNEVDSRTIGKA